MSRGAADSIEMSVHPSGPRPVIVIGVPSFGMVHLMFMARYYNLRMPMNTIQKHIYVVGKEVGDARNEIVAKALSLDQADPSIRCAKILFLDDDVLVHPDALLKLLEHNRPIVSGLYYTKTSVPTPLVLHGDYEGTARSWMPGELVECHGHGMGICLIDADVFRHVRDGVRPHLLDDGHTGARVETCWCGAAPGQPHDVAKRSDPIGVDKFGHPAWFSTTKDAVVLNAAGHRQVMNQTEDMRFLGLARQLGYGTAVDTSAQAFGWHLDTKTMQAYPLKQFQEFQAKGTITWDTEQGPVTW